MKKGDTQIEREDQGRKNIYARTLAGVCGTYMLSSMTIGMTRLLT